MPWTTWPTAASQGGASSSTPNERPAVAIRDAEFRRCIDCALSLERYFGFRHEDRQTMDVGASSPLPVAAVCGRLVGSRSFASSLDHCDTSPYELPAQACTVSLASNLSQTPDPARSPTASPARCAAAGAAWRRAPTSRCTQGRRAAPPTRPNPRDLPLPPPPMRTPRGWPLATAAPSAISFRPVSLRGTGGNRNVGPVIRYA